MKKRILTIALVIALLATCFAGTYAYLTDTDAQKNTFTVGKVYITLDEAKVTQDDAGNWIPDGTDRVVAEKDEVTGNDYHLLPNTTVAKDPTITVDAESEDAWVAAKVTITGNLLTLIPMEGSTTMIDITKVAEGGLLDGTPAPKNNWNGLPVVHETEDCVIYQVPGSNTWTLYIFMKDQKAAEEKVVLFEQLVIPAEWDNAEMQKVNNMEINVQAFATQTNGFADCFTAMTTAFAQAFPFDSANP